MRFDRPAPLATVGGDLDIVYNDMGDTAADVFAAGITVGGDTNVYGN